ncbi:MAG: hypothetical protein JNL64_09590 [Blastocatellia bacterium]|nr:hypothetical protein [Blastocatellia bacterium]
MSEVFISRDAATGDLLAAAAYIGERISSADGRAGSMASVVPAYLERGEVDLAAELANGVEDPFSRDKLLSMVSEKCARLDDDEYAMQLADAIEENALREHTIERIAVVKAEKGQYEAATEIGGQLDLTDNVEAAIAINKATTDLDGAIAIVDGIGFAPSQVGALRAIAEIQSESGDTAGAVRCLEASLGYAEMIEHDEERIRYLCDIGNSFVNAKRNDLAIKAFDLAFQQTKELDNIHRDFFFSNCALGFLHSNSQDLAEKALDEIRDKTQMASSLVGFARESWKKEEKQTAIEDLDEAFEILKSQRDIETRDTRAKNALMAAIAAQFAGFGKHELGLEAAAEVTDPNEKAAAISQIAQVLVLQNEDQLAREVLDVFEETSGRVGALLAMSDVKRDKELSDDAIALIDEAVSHIVEIPQHVLRSELLNGAAYRFALLGQEAKAREATVSNLKLISEIRDESSRSTQVAAIAPIYSENGYELGEAETSGIYRLLTS